MSGQRRRIKLTVIEIFTVTRSGGEQVADGPRRFMVDKVENATDWKIGAILVKKDIDELIEKGITVVIEGKP